MKLKFILILLSVGVVFASCKPKDADIQKAITEQITSNESMSGLSVSVSEGVATVTGECADDACKTSCENAIKGMKGVKSVVNNITVPAPVVINNDDAIMADVNNVVVNYEGVDATVLDGVITLTGEITKDKLMELMPAVQALNPKKVVNQITVK